MGGGMECFRRVGTGVECRYCFTRFGGARVFTFLPRGAGAATAAAQFSMHGLQP